MASTIPSLEKFKYGPGAKPKYSGRVIYFDNPQNIITLHPLTITNVNCTPAIAHVGNRPAVSLAGAGAASDGSNMCIGVAGIRPQAGKKVIVGGTVNSAAIADHEFCAGLFVVGTGLTAALNGGTTPTDYIGISKDTTETVMTLGARKASGTEYQHPLSMPALVNDTWYRWEVHMTRDATVAGRAKVEVYFGEDSREQVDCVYNETIASAFPDTVSLAPAFGFLNGAASGTAILAVSEFGWAIERP